MMAVPMDNSLDISSQEHVQRLLSKNAELESKRRKAAQARVASDPNSWHQMRDNYEAIILEDHAFSEQHEIEYALWQLHYRKIEELRARFNAALASNASTTSQNGKGPPRNGPDNITKIRTQLKNFLSESTGFYHDLMVKIRAKYGLPLGGFSDDPENHIPSSKDGKKPMELKKGLISCHRCLIYLGDLARYKGLYGDGDSKARDFAAASSYYLQASSLWPSSGNPHHQLAILGSYSGDELVAIYRYFRSLAVENPFTTARDNLIIAFEKNRQSYSQLPGDAKALSVKAPSRTTGKGRGKCETRQPLKDEKVASLPKEKASSMSGIFKTFRTGFVRLNGILFTRTSLETFEEVLSMVKNDLLELLSSGSDEKYNFGSDAADCRLAIVRIVAILIFTIHNVNKESDYQSYAEILQRSVLLQNAFTAAFEFMGHVVERCIQLNDPSSSFLLPGILVFVEWLACHQDIALGNEPEEKQARARSFFWKNCIACFNKLLLTGSKFVDEDEEEACFFNMSRYDEAESGNRLALPEDFELRGFVPLLPAQLILDFSRKHSFGGDSGSKEKKTRLQRMIAAGKALANVVRVGDEGIYFDTRGKKFIIGVEPQISDDYQLNYSMEVTKLSGVGLESPDARQLTVGDLQPKQQLFVESEEEDEVIVFKPSVTEKVNGISSNTMTLPVPVSGISTTNVPSGASIASVGICSEMGPFSSALEGLSLQSSWGTNVRPPISIAHTNTQYMQPIQSSTSMWCVEQGAVMNGLGGLNLMGNGPTTEAEILNHSEMVPPAAYSVPLPQYVKFSTGNNIHVQVPEAAVQSTFSPLTSSVAGFESMSMKSSSVNATGMKKNPVSRPVRHLGPPPGFGSVPSKITDDSSSGLTLKNENNPIPRMDDYSWLDGYQLPSTHQSIGYNNPNNHSTQTYHSVSNSGSLAGMVSFPFPGKQVPSSLHMQSDIQRANQQSVALAQQQYPGQTLWEDRFFV